MISTCVSAFDRAILGVLLGVIDSKLVDCLRTIGELLQRVLKRSSWSKWKSIRFFLGDAVRNLATKTVQ